MGINKTIGGKLYLGFGLIMAIVLMAFVFNWAAVHHEQTTRAIYKQSITMGESLSKLDKARSDNRLFLRNFLLNGDRREADSLTRGQGEVERLINEIKENTTALGDSSRAKQLLDQLADAERDWSRVFATPLMEKRRQVDTGSATVAELQIAYLQATPTPEQKQKEEQPLLQLAGMMKAANATAEDSDNSAATLITVVTLGGLLIVILLSGSISWRVAKSITAPLSQLITVAGQIGNTGDLEQKVEITGEDEVAQLARTFNNMVLYLREMAGISEAIAGGDLSVEINPRSSRDTLGKAFREMTLGLRNLVKNVRDSAAQVASGSNQVASASDESAKISVQAASAIDEVTSTMHEMSINVQNMVKSTQMQGSNVSETSASIDEMVASIQRVADTAKVLLDISQRSRDEVHSGINTMEKATDGLSRINASIGSSAEIISALGQRADDIGKIIEVIDDLAEQTNLLALNAAIEAARAGEHGLGFAVVADEVRKLAEKSAQSTREISELIQSIQKEARKAVDNMEKSTTIVNEGLSLGGDLSGALKKISSVVSEVYKFAQEIGAATNEQSHGSSQIAKATTRLNEITHEINSSVEEQASGAQAVVRAMEKMRELVQRSSSGSTELAASAEQMSKMSRSMLEAMDRFVLENMQPQRDNRGGQRRNDEQQGRPATPQYASAAAGGNYN
ncbi:MAG: methyl-accepting chemotaxis sensory transducer [Candidatus Angelobacter sp.]|nr:methyl-accepting chemotaxis sensory transducer [Candidatus Angelobacter sp.]MCU1334083.1 methyl-accepting chemotaxis sensory transducer [Candidatus Angelobacter sp.]